MKCNNAVRMMLLPCSFPSPVPNLLLEPLDMQLKPAAALLALLVCVAVGGATAAREAQGAGAQGERRERNDEDAAVRLLVVYWSVTNWTAALGAEVVRTAALCKRGGRGERREAAGKKRGQEKDDRSAVLLLLSVKSAAVCRLCVWGCRERRCIGGCEWPEGARLTAACAGRRGRSFVCSSPVPRLFRASAVTSCSRRHSRYAKSEVPFAIA